MWSQQVLLSCLLLGEAVEREAECPEWGLDRWQECQRAAWLAQECLLILNGMGRRDFLFWSEPCGHGNGHPGW